jgi:hypothetical protein
MIFLIDCRGDKLLFTRFGQVRLVVTYNNVRLQRMLLVTIHESALPSVVLLCGSVQRIAVVYVSTFQEVCLIILLCGH